MDEFFSRTVLLIGEEGVERLLASRVAVFGIGGVGSFAVEALARSGVGALDLIDHDVVAPSNLNRQLIATRSVLGRYKTDVAKERIADIHPACRVSVRHDFFLPENARSFSFDEYDYVIDAIDTVTGKLAIIEAAKAAGTPVISAMGAGNKIHGENFRVADLYETRGCPLARIMRRECKKRGIDRLKVVYSPDKPMERTASVSAQEKENAPGRRDIPGSVSFVPSVAGLILAGEVIRDLAHLS